MEFKAQQIAALISGTVEGNPEVSIHTFAKIEEGVEGALSFYYDPKFESYVYQTNSSVLLVPNSFEPTHPVKATLIRVADPRMAIALLMGKYEEMTKPKRTGVDPKASISPTAKLGKDVYIAPFVVIEDGAEIGDGTQLYAHVFIGADAKVGKDCVVYPSVTIYHDCIVGNHCTLHANCVIGADGFGFQPDEHGYHKIPQIGITVLEDDVEIGANTCIDRAMMGETIIRKGVKIDNLVQIGHNVEIGANTILCGQVGIAGSTKLGEWCVMTGQVGVADHLTVADHTIAASQAGIATHIRKPGQTIMGYPAYDAKQCSRANIAFKSLPELLIQVRQLQKEVDALKKWKDEN